MVLSASPSRQAASRSTEAMPLRRALNMLREDFKVRAISGA